MDAFIRTSLRGPAAALAAGLAIAHAGAQEAAPFASVSGFGTLGLAHSSLDHADFTGNPSKPRGAGHSEALSFEVDSLLAAQLTLRPGQRLSAVLQVIAEQNYDGTYRPHVEWANIRYRFTPELDLRLGRTVLPVLLVTESRKVGYANPWVRPPVEVYGLVPFTNSDGLDASLRLPVGLATNTLQASAGRSNPGFPAGASGTTIARVRGAVSLADTVEYGFAAARLSLGRARLTIPAVNTLFDSFRELGPAGAALADRYDVDDSLVTFVGAGAIYDPGDWFAMGEWTRTDSDSLRGKRTGWYVGGGFRFGKVTPYLVHARVRADNLSDPGLALSALPARVVPAAAGLNAALNAALSAKPVQSTVSVGARWDVSRNAALKLQFDRTRIGAGSTGMLGNIQPGFRTGGTFNVLSASIDFVLR